MFVNKQSSCQNGSVFMKRANVLDEIVAEAFLVGTVIVVSFGLSFREHVNIN